MSIEENGDANTDRDLMNSNGSDDTSNLEAGDELLVVVPRQYDIEAARRMFGGYFLVAANPPPLGAEVDIEAGWRARHGHVILDVPDYLRPYTDMRCWYVRGNQFNSTIPRVMRINGGMDNTAGVRRNDRGNQFHNGGMHYTAGGPRNDRGNHFHNATMHNTAAGVPNGNQNFQYVTNNHLHLHGGRVQNVDNRRVYNDFTVPPQSSASGSTGRFSTNNAASMLQVSVSAFWAVLTIVLSKANPILYVSMVASLLSFITGILCMFTREENSRNAKVLGKMGAIAISVAVIMGMAAAVPTIGCVSACVVLCLIFGAVIIRS